MGVPDGLRDARAGRYAIQYLSPGWLRIDRRSIRCGAIRGSGSWWTRCCSGRRSAFHTRLAEPRQHRLRQPEPRHQPDLGPHEVLLRVAEKAT
jgi:hypothetical protein